MKRNELIQALNEMKEMTRANMVEKIDQLVAELTTSTESKAKIARFVHVRERVLDPACKYPRQMIACHEILESLGKETLTLDEVKAAIGENAEKLNTRQDPYRIYGFYQKPMEEAGWIAREKVSA